MKELIVRREGTAGRLTLNRPEALGALTLSMCRDMIAALLEWRDDPAVRQVMLDHAGERGFCAGGDIRNLAAGHAGDGSPPRNFFFTEYRLNHLLFVYPKPVVAFMDGVTMGGGVGISLPARFRIATERTVFAMPETGIGLFPDVGAGWHLPRLPHRAGYWLALTGARIKAADCLGLGVASHFIPTERLEAAKAALAGEDDIEATLARFAADPGAPQAPYAKIETLFDGSTVETILERLDAEGSEWAQAQAGAIRARSPLMSKAALRLLQTGAKAAGFAGDLAVEYRLAVRAVPSHDFTEGVRAVIIERDNAPVWDPPTLDAASEDRVAALFEPLPPNEEWTPLEGEA